MIEWFVPVCHECEKALCQPREDRSKAEMKQRHHQRNHRASHNSRVSGDADTEMVSYDAEYLGSKWPGERPTYEQIQGGAA